jgi:anti-sigma B factor antagonist
VAGSLEFGVVDEAIDDNTHLVAPSGEIDAYTAPKLGRRLLTLVDQGKTGVVVDLSGVTFLDSTALGVLLNAVRQLSSRRGQLILVCPSERVQRPFQITGLAERLSITGSREEALGQLA